MFKTIVATAALLASVDARHVNDEASLNMDSFFRTHGKEVTAEELVKRNDLGSRKRRVNSPHKIDPMVQRTGGSKCIATELHFYNAANCENCDVGADAATLASKYPIKHGRAPSVQEIKDKLKAAGAKIDSVETTAESSEKKRFKLTDLPRRSRHIDVAVAEQKERSASSGEKKRDLGAAYSSFLDLWGHNGNTMVSEYLNGVAMVGGVPSDYFGIFNNRCHPRYDDEGNVHSWWMTRVHWDQEEDVYTWRYLVFGNDKGEYSCDQAASRELFEMPIWDYTVPIGPLGMPMGEHSIKLALGYAENRGFLTLNCVEKEEMKGLYVLYQGKENDCSPGAAGFNQLYSTAIGYVPPETQYERLEEYDNENWGTSYTYHSNWEKREGGGAPFKNQHPIGEVLFTAGGRYNDYRHNSFEYTCPQSVGEYGGPPSSDPNLALPTGGFRDWVANAQTYYPSGGSVFRLTRSFQENCNDMLPEEMEDITTNRQWHYGYSEVAGVFCYTNDAKLNHYYSKVCVNHYADFYLHNRYHSADYNYHKEGWGWWTKNIY